MRSVNEGTLSNGSGETKFLGEDATLMLGLLIIGLKYDNAARLALAYHIIAYS